MLTFILKKKQIYNYKGFIDGDKLPKHNTKQTYCK